MMRKTILEDAYLVAFLALKGHKITPIKESRKVVFEVQGDTSNSLAAYYGNEQLGAQEYVQALKMVKSWIFSLKAR